MKSIDNYLCKEKKEVYKINTQPAIVSYAAMTKAAVEASVKQQNEFNEQYRDKRESNNGYWLLGSLSSWWPF